MDELALRVLVVDDNLAWRHYACSTLQKIIALRVMSEAADGTEALQKAHQLRPDLILLDIGLPDLNGIVVNRRISESLPNSRVLFLTENRDPDVMIAVIKDGARGYVLKSDGADELLQAIETVLRGEIFISRFFVARRFSGSCNISLPVETMLDPTLTETR